MFKQNSSEKRDLRSKVSSTNSASTTERIMATTMSVDEYFDELIASFLSNDKG